MKFTDVDMEKHLLIKKDIPEKCLMCDNKTNYVEILSHGRFCSSECLKLFYKEVDEGAERAKKWVYDK